MDVKVPLLDQMRHIIRLKHMSYRTEQAYISWVRRFILFHHKRHPAEMGADEIRAFLTPLAVESHVAASTPNGALNALLFLYRHVLKQPFPDLGEFERAKRPRRLPLVFTQEEVRAVLAQLEQDMVALAARRAGLSLDARQFAMVCAAAPYVDEMRQQLARERDWDEAPANVFASTRI